MGRIGVVLHRSARRGSGAPDAAHGRRVRILEQADAHAAVRVLLTSTIRDDPQRRVDLFEPIEARGESRVYTGVELDDLLCEVVGSLASLAAPSLSLVDEAGAVDVSASPIASTTRRLGRIPRDVLDAVIADGGARSGDAVGVVLRRAETDADAQCRVVVDIVRLTTKLGTSPGSAVAASSCVPEIG